MQTFSGKLLAWYDQYRRDLPWRRTKDPYAIWVSEIMLQQTQVDTVLPYYRKFLKTFPSVGHLARAPIEKVLSLWSGLGYYSRARNLHRAAQAVLANHGGNLPDTREAILKLPGIGRYTAGAILSIAFDRPEPILDGNVIRVFTRLFAIQKDPKKSEIQKQLWDLAVKCVQCKRPGDLNQSLMELGALVCTPKQPCCDLCPLRNRCKAYAQGCVEDLPIKSKKTKSVSTTHAVALVAKGRQWLLAKRPASRHLGEMWEFPQMEKLGKKVAILKNLPPISHAIMNRRMTVVPVLCRWKGGALPKQYYTEYLWTPANRFAQLPSSSLNQKVFKQIRKGV